MLGRAYSHPGNYSTKVYRYKTKKSTPDAEAQTKKCSRKKSGLPEPTSTFIDVHMGCKQASSQKTKDSSMILEEELIQEQDWPCYDLMQVNYFCLIMHESVRQKLLLWLLQRIG